MIKETCGIFFIDKSGLILVGHVTNSDNKWSIPKGLKNCNETYLECAVREFKEETDIDINSPIKLIGEFVYRHKQKKLITYVSYSEKYFRNFKPVCHSMVESNIEFPEFDKFAWVTFKEAQGLLHKTQCDALEKLQNESTY